jgi:hypothetical protein
MQLHQPADAGRPPRRLPKVLIWSALTLLAAVALALAMVVANLALELRSDPTPPPPTPPMQFNPPGGHPMAQ